MVKKTLRLCAHDVGRGKHRVYASGNPACGAAFGATFQIKNAWIMDSVYMPTKPR